MGKYETHRSFGEKYPEKKKMFSADSGTCLAELRPLAAECIRKGLYCCVFFPPCVGRAAWQLAFLGGAHLQDQVPYHAEGMENSRYSLNHGF